MKTAKHQHRSNPHLPALTRIFDNPREKATACDVGQAFQPAGAGGFPAASPRAPWLEWAARGTVAAILVAALALTVWGTSAAQVEVEDTNSVAAATAHPQGIDHDDVVSIGKDVELRAQDSSKDVVVIIGSAKIHGKAKGDVVAICGDVDVDGDVDGDVVAVLGSVRAASGGRIGGDAVAVGGSVDTAEGARLEKSPVQIYIAKPQWIRQWFTHCALKLRPLAPEVGWVWIVAGVFFLMYLMVGAIFRRPVQACVDELTRRPATTFVFGLLTKLLVPVVTLILIATGIGLVVVPFIIATLFLGAIVGKVALMESLGLALGRQFGLGALGKPLAAFVLGWIVITLFYIIPILGLMAFGLVGLWGLGGAAAAAFAALRRERPERSIPPPSLPTPPMAASGGAGESSQPGVAPAAAPFAGAGQPEVPGLNPHLAQPATPPLSTPAPAPNVPEALAYPRAGFWERVGAAFLDVVLVSILVGLVQGPLLHFFVRHFGGCSFGLIVALAYFSGMWAWKGTTIGGIVLNLKVVRLDNQPITFPIALVRALAAMFSVVVLFLGFLWIAWDRDRQGWHDRIAGTVVVRLPRGRPLVCL
jgi:uncharacterized RDD family membrane protein YckC